MLGTLATDFFRVRERNMFIRENFAKVGHYNHYVKGCHPLPPGVRQEKGTGEFRFGSGSVPCVVLLFRTITLPFIGSSQASKGEASPQPNTMVLKGILAPDAVTA